MVRVRMFGGIWKRVRRVSVVWKRALVDYVGPFASAREAGVRVKPGV